MLEVIVIHVIRAVVIVFLATTAWVTIRLICDGSRP